MAALDVKIKVAEASWGGNSLLKIASRYKMTARYVMGIIAAGTSFAANAWSVDWRSSVEDYAFSSDRLLTESTSLHALRVNTTSAAKAGGWSFLGDLDLGTRDSHGNGDSLAVREAFAQYGNRQWSIRVGAQIHAWGRADVLNPTDNLTPRNYTWLVANDASQRLGTPSVQLRYSTAIGTISAISLPVFRPSRVPLGALAQLPVDDRVPNGMQDAYALKLDHAGGKVEWSVSYFQGLLLRPSVVPGSVPGAGIALEYPRGRVVGADFATPLLGGIARGEVAFVMPSGRDIHSIELGRRRNVFTVMGLEYALPREWRVVPQLFYKRNYGAVNASGTSGEFASEIYRVNRILNEDAYDDYAGLSAGLYSAEIAPRFAVSLDTAYVLGKHDFTLRPRARLRLLDDLFVSLGGDVFSGNRASMFGRLHDNTLIFVGLEWRQAGRWESAKTVQTESYDNIRDGEQKSAVQIYKCGIGLELGQTKLASFRFYWNEVQLRKNELRKLDKMAERLIDEHECHLAISGYTEGDMTDLFHQNISMARAGYVMNYLALKGVKKESMTICPVVNSARYQRAVTLEKRRVNRRVDIKISQNAEPNLCN